MDTTTIVLLLVAIVTVSIVIIVLSQMRERARIERARKITAQEDAYNRANRLLTEIPGQYLTADLKLKVTSHVPHPTSQLVPRPTVCLQSADCPTTVTVAVYSLHVFYYSNCKKLYCSH